MISFIKTVFGVWRAKIGSYILGGKKLHARGHLESKTEEVIKGEGLQVFSLIILRLADYWVCEEVQPVRLREISVPLNTRERFTFWNAHSSLVLFLFGVSYFQSCPGHWSWRWGGRCPPGLWWWSCAWERSGPLLWFAHWERTNERWLKCCGNLNNRTITAAFWAAEHNSIET